MQYTSKQHGRHVHTRSSKMTNRSHNENGMGTGASDGECVFTVKIRTLRVTLANVQRQIETNDDFATLQRLIVIEQNTIDSINRQYSAKLNHGAKK